jgi:hypothetical protein
MTCSMSLPWYTEFCGVTMVHNYYLYHLVSIHVRTNPQLRAIVELGTGEGALTIYCGLLSQAFGLSMHTFDIQRLFDERTACLLQSLGVTFHQADIFAEQTRHIIQGLCELGPIYLICDNGNKRQEVATFVPLLHRESLVSVHDYGSEIHDDDVASLPLEPVGVDEWLKFNVQFATWKKCGD